MSPRIGSLCSGYGGLDMAIREVFGGTVAWHCQYEPPDKKGREDKHQYAAQILAHRYPDVPNHGDLTRVDWNSVEPVDILAAGFPCTDLSYAGRGEGIKEGTRSGLWLTIADAIGALRPRLVVLENVRAIVNRRPGLDVVLADLARLGFDASWTCLPASGVGATHERYRWFCLAWPTDSPRPGLEGSRLRGRVASSDRVASDADRVGHEWDRPAGQPSERHASSAGRLVADAPNLGHERGRPPRDGRPGPADRRLAAADAAGNGRHEWRTEPAGFIGGSDAPLSSASAAAHAYGDAPSHDGELPAGWDALQQWVRDDVAGRRSASAANADLGGLRADQRDVRAGQPDIEWGAYGPAIRRWEHILGRPAPRPVDDRGRLAAPFVEWMMGLPAGHVCDVPAPDGMTAAGLRNARLKALGNGVVPQQAAYALRLLAARAFSEVAA